MVFDEPPTQVDQDRGPRRASRPRHHLPDGLSPALKVAICTEVRRSVGNGLSKALGSDALDLPSNIRAAASEYPRSGRILSKPIPVNGISPIRINSNSNLSGIKSSNRIRWSTGISTGGRTFITNAARKILSVGESLRDVQSFAGHSSLTTTQRYIERCYVMMSLSKYPRVLDRQNRDHKPLSDPSQSLERSASYRIVAA